MDIMQWLASISIGVEEKHWGARTRTRTRDRLCSRIQ